MVPDLMTGNELSELNYGLETNINFMTQQKIGVY